MKEKIQKSEALPDFISRRCNEVYMEWTDEHGRVEGIKHYLPHERELYGKYLAYKEILDGIRNNYFNGKYNNIHPNKSVRRLRAIQQRDTELKFWKDKVKYLAPNLIDNYYKEVDALLIKEGYLL